MNETADSHPAQGTLTSIDINFDSLGWSAGRDPNTWRDPTFFEIADRFLRYSEKYKFKYTIFIIGRDLENSEVRERVRQWSKAGHEIANHSYHHHPDLGSRPIDEIEREIRSAHDLIAETCGVAPRGFVAPAWSASPDLLRILEKLGYLYDTSVFPSWLMLGVRAKLFWNFRNDTRRKHLLRRKDAWANLFAPTNPYHPATGSLMPGAGNNLLVLPLPTTPVMRIPAWHTAAFIFPSKVFDHCLRTCLQSQHFYYLVHPADLMDQEDLDRLGVAAGNMERIAVPLAAKEALFDRHIGRIVHASRRMVRLDELANSILSHAACS